MQWRNTDASYGGVAKLFHWVMALLILGMLAVGLYMTGMSVSPDKFKLYGLHKSTGAIVLMLAVLRLVWRVTGAVPRLPVAMRWFEKFGAHASHWALYLLMFAMPLTGWAMSSAGGMPVSVFGWFTLPDLVSPDKEWKYWFREAHGVLAWTLIGVIAVHVAAALSHHFYYKDNVLRRMMPWVRSEEKADA